ncbi:MAG TPA: UpxY family transcription antiterminator [Syntrophales bacterium]|nr:UpxY family transcription antiterminator [Syntrophales bacterium]HPQ44489.1 UpxY family transcription antiterminator [Syntrophales bacterium]
MPWYAVYTKSRFENKVYVGLIQRSVETFLPKIEVWSRRKDRKKKIHIPMFSGYLFVMFPEYTTEKKLNVLTTPGVVKMLDKPDSHEPLQVPDSQIDAIKRLVASDVEIQPYLYPGEGEWARITDGPFKGIEGIVMRVDYRRHVFVVSIDILQRSVAIKLEGFQIEKI